MSSPVVGTGLVEALFAGVKTSDIYSPTWAHPISWLMVMLLVWNTFVSLTPPRSIYCKAFGSGILRPCRNLSRPLCRQSAGVVALSGCSRSRAGVVALLGSSRPRLLCWRSAGVAALSGCSRSRAGVVALMGSSRPRLLCWRSAGVCLPRGRHIELLRGVNAAHNL